MAKPGVAMPASVSGKHKSSSDLTAAGLPIPPAERKPVIPGFLTKTFDIFSNEKFLDICSWSDDGDTIMIKKPSEFATQVLPMYFKHSNFQSFVRQLNMYDFHKTVQDPSRREFQHPHFLRGRRDLLHLIKRKVPEKQDSVVKPNQLAKIEQEVSELSPSQQDTSSTEELKGEILRSQTLTGPKQDSEGILQELVALKKRTQLMECNIKNLQNENEHIIHENSMLWSSLQSSRERQLEMQTKIQKILFFLYEIYVHGKDGRKLGNHVIGEGIQGSESEPHSQPPADGRQTLEGALIARLGGSLSEQAPIFSSLPGFQDMLKYVDIDIRHAPTNPASPGNGPIASSTRNIQQAGRKRPLYEAYSVPEGTQLLDTDVENMIVTEPEIDIPSRIEAPPSYETNRSVQAEATQLVEDEEATLDKINILEDHLTDLYDVQDFDQLLEELRTAQESSDGHRNQSRSSITNLSPRVGNQTPCR